MYDINSSPPTHPYFCRVEGKGLKKARWFPSFCIWTTNGLVEDEIRILDATDVSVG